MSDGPEELEAFLHVQIPLAAAMGVRVVQADAERVVLAAPLSPNLNHRRTFFGGSASALATLSAWALAHSRLLAEVGPDAHVVVQRSSMEYLEPAVAEVQAECLAPPVADWERMLRTIQRRGKGRIRLHVELRAARSVVGTFKGWFVARTGRAGEVTR